MIGLEFTGETGPIQRNFDALAALALDAGGQSASVRFGTGTVTWPGGSRLTDTTTVTHGLGRAPAVILFGSASTNMHPRWANKTATTFEVVGNAVDDSSPGAGTTGTFDWLVIG